MVGTCQRTDCGLGFVNPIEHSSWLRQRLGASATLLNSATDLARSSQPPVCTPPCPMLGRRSRAVKEAKEAIARQKEEAEAAASKARADEATRKE